MKKLLVTLVFLMPAAASAADNLPLASGTYSSGVCAPGKIDDTFQIATHDEGKNKGRRYLALEGGEFCEIATGKMSGNTYSEKMKCYSEGAAGQMPIGSRSVKLTIANDKTVTYNGNTLHWCWK